MPDRDPLKSRVEASRWAGEESYGPGDPLDPLDGRGIVRLLLWAFLLIPLLDALHAFARRGRK